MTTSLRASFAVVLFLLAAVPLAHASDPYRVGGEVLRPEKISGEPPEYTEMARKAQVTGVVILEVVIDEQGNVTDTRVLKSLPMGLDQEAVEAVRGWKFKPATRAGLPVPVYSVLTVNFQLDSGLSIGPLFGQFLRDNPEFAELVRGKSWDDALHFLDRGPYSAEVHLARTYIFVALGRLADAWEEAQAYDGPEPYEVSEIVAGAALEEAVQEPDDVKREELIDLGLQAVKRALEGKKDDPSAMATRALLLREKAALAGEVNVPFR